MPTINWDDMEKAHEEASRPAPAGRYVLELKSLTEGESKKGDFQIKIIWQIAEGPYKGKVATEYLTLNPEKPVTISIARNAINMLGVADFKAWGQLDPSARKEMFVGRRIEADLETREYNDRVSNNIKQKIRAITGSSTGSLPDGMTPPPRDESTPAAPVNPLAGI